jgi:hypothetical protein
LSNPLEPPDLHSEKLECAEESQKIKISSVDTKAEKPLDQQLYQKERLIEPPKQSSYLRDLIDLFDELPMNCTNSVFQDERAYMGSIDSFSSNVSKSKSTPSSINSGSGSSAGYSPKLHFHSSTMHNNSNNSHFYINEQSSSPKEEANTQAEAITFNSKEPNLYYNSLFQQDLFSTSEKIPKSESVRPPMNNLSRTNPFLDDLKAIEPAKQSNTSTVDTILTLRPYTVNSLNSFSSSPSTQVFNAQYSCLQLQQEKVKAAPKPNVDDMLSKVINDVFNDFKAFKPSNFSLSKTTAYNSN